jgi:uncharacterized phage protein (TIGR02218 family)
MAFKDSIQGSNPYVAEIYDIEFEDGTHKRFTSAGKNIDFDGDTYYAVPISRADSKQEGSVKVGALRVTAQLGNLTDSLIDINEIRHRRTLDRAELKLYQVDLNDKSNYQLFFNGFTGRVMVTNTLLEVNFRDIFFLMKQKIPANTFSRSCPWGFGSDECTLTLSSEKISGTADAGGDDRLILDSGITEDDGYFNRGFIEITSGSLSGERSTVINYTTGSFLCLTPFSEAVGSGTTFDVYPHCQKTRKRCKEFFANSDNFRGFTHIPRPEELHS